MPAERTRANRLACRIVLTLALLAAFPALAASLTVTQATGEAKIRFDDLWQTPQPGMVVNLPAVVSTGENGSVMLEQDGTVISVASRSAIELHADAATGQVLQRVVQDSGSAFYDVAPQGSRRFRVESPYLVAVVKGTQFNVTVTPDMATVSLFEGHLQVDAPGVGDSVEIYSGEIARRHRGEDRITVIDMADGEIASRSDPPTPVPDEDSAETGGGNDEDPATRSVADSGGSAADGDSVAVDNGRVIAGAEVELDKSGATVDAGLAAVETETDVEVAVGLAGDSADVGVDASLSAPGVTADAGLQVGADLGGGSVDASADVGVDAGIVAADAGAAVGVDLADGVVDAGADLSVTAGDLTADAGVDVGADLGGGSVDVDTDVGLGAGDLSADAGVDVGADLGNGSVDVDTDVGLGAGDLSADAGVDVGADLGGGTVDIGADTDIGGGDVNAGAGLGIDDDGVSIDTGAAGAGSSVTAGVDVDSGGAVGVGIDAGGVDLDLGLDLGLGGDDPDLADTGALADVADDPDADADVADTGTDTDDGVIPDLRGLLSL